jgi:hypothetical protein
MKTLGIAFSLAVSVVLWFAILSGYQAALTHIHLPAQYIGKLASTTIILGDQETVTKMCMGLDYYFTDCQLASNHVGWPITVLVRYTR